MLEQDIPSGFEVDAVQLEHLHKMKGVQHVEISIFYHGSSLPFQDKKEKNILALFLSQLTDEMSFSVDMKTTLSGQVLLQGFRVLPMYQPEQIITGSPLWIIVNK